MIFFTALTAIAAFIAIWMSNRALEASINASRADQRAWVGVVEAGLGGPPSGLQIVVENSGKSPARNVLQAAGWKRVPHDTVIDVEAEVSKRHPTTQGVLQPNARRNLGPLDETTPKQEEVAAVDLGSFDFYVFGLLTYDDIFGASHRTKFCMKMVVKSGGSFAPYGDYNDAD